MTDIRPRTRAGLVLCFVFDTRYAGYAALDGFGLAPSGFRSTTVKQLTATRRRDSLVLKLRDTIERFSPARLVLGVSRRARRFARSFLTRARALASRLGLPVVERDASSSARLLLGDSHSRRGALGRALVDQFRLADALPRRGRGAVDLERRIARRGERTRCHRAAWQAVALALLELTEQRPFAAGALVREGARLAPAYKRRLTEAANRVTV